MTATALCLTRDRRRWLPRAIRSFQQQAYDNREMLILASGESVRDLIPDDSRIWLVDNVQEDMPIGEKRNLGCSMIKTDVVAVWDDDDWSEPGRLGDQIARLQQTGKAVTGYHTMKFTDGSRWWQYQGWPAFAVGTSLCFLRSWWEAHRFRPQHIGEDYEFVVESFSKRQFIAAGDLNLMFASIHDSNTSPRDRKAGFRWVELPGFSWPGESPYSEVTFT